MDSSHHGGSGLLVGRGTLAVVEAAAFDQPGQASFLVAELRQGCGGIGILGLQHLVKGHDVGRFPALLDGRVPVGVGDATALVDVGAVAGVAPPPPRVPKTWVR